MIEALCTGNSRYKAAESLQPVGVVLHSIGTPQPSAQVLRDYWQRNASPYVVHYVVDNKEIYHCMPDGYKCWHVGSPGNGKYLGIETTEPSQIKYTSGASFQILNVEAAQVFTAAVYQNAVQLIAQLCTSYGWNPDTAVWTHGEITKKKMSNTDHVDPEHLWNGLGMGYDLAKLRKDVKAEMAKTVLGSSSSTGSAGGPSSSGSQQGKSYVVRITASALNVRKGPGTTYEIVQTLPKGGGYTIVEETQSGWGLLKSYAAGRNGWISLNYTQRV